MLENRAPEIPTGLTAESMTCGSSNGNPKVCLEWNANPDPDLAGYYLYRKDLSNATEATLNGGVAVTPLGSSTETFTNEGDSDISGGNKTHTFEYWLVAVDLAGNMSLPSAAAQVIPVDTDTPDAPHWDSPATVSHPASLDLYWKTNSSEGIDPDGEVTGYYLYRNETGAFDSSSEPYVPTPFGPAQDQLQYTDSMVTPGVTYSYALKALHVTGTLSASFSTVESAATADILAPQAPDWLTVDRSANAWELELNWQVRPEADLAGYNVYKRMAGETVWEGRDSNPQQGTTLPLTAQDPDWPLVQGEYEFQVEAVDSSGNLSPRTPVVSERPRIDSVVPIGAPDLVPLIEPMVTWERLALEYPEALDTAYGLALYQAPSQDGPWERAGGFTGCGLGMCGTYWVPSPPVCGPYYYATAWGVGDDETYLGVPVIADLTVNKLGIGDPSIAGSCIWDPAMNEYTHRFVIWWDGTNECDLKSYEISHGWTDPPFAGQEGSPAVLSTIYVEEIVGTSGAQSSIYSVRPRYVDTLPGAPEPWSPSVSFSMTASNCTEVASMPAAPTNFIPSSVDCGLSESTYYFWSSWAWDAITDPALVAYEVEVRGDNGPWQSLDPSPEDPVPYAARWEFVQKLASELSGTTHFREYRVRSVFDNGDVSLWADGSLTYTLADCDTGSAQSFPYAYPNPRESGWELAQYSSPNSEAFEALSPLGKSDALPGLCDPAEVQRLAGVLSAHYHDDAAGLRPTPSTTPVAPEKSGPSFANMCRIPEGDLLVAQLDPICLPPEHAEGAGAVIAMTLPDDESNAEDPWWETVRLWESPYKVIGQTPGIQFDTYFYHVDHLGTPRLITDINGDVVTYHKYDPFGEEFQPLQSPNTHQFTGHERDPETGLDYMMARYCSNSYGRFLSVDPALASARHRAPQSWNRYTYVANSPLAYIDPDGEKLRNVEVHLGEQPRAGRARELHSAVTTAERTVAADGSEYLADAHQLQQSESVLYDVVLDETTVFLTPGGSDKKSGDEAWTITIHTGGAEGQELQDTIEDTIVHELTEINNKQAADITNADAHEKAKEVEEAHKKKREEQRKKEKSETQKKK